MTFYTYIHQKPDGSIFYVGKGQRGRLNSTLSGRSAHWREAAKEGFTSLKLAEWDTAKEALDHEAILIACLRDMGVSLANRTTGGQNGRVAPITEQTRERMRAAQKRINDRCLVDPEWALRIRASRARAGSSTKAPGLHAQAARTFRERFGSDSQYAARVSENRRRASEKALLLKREKVEEKVRLVRTLRANGYLLKAIAEVTGYSVSSLSQILNGKMLVGVGE